MSPRISNKFLIHLDRIYLERGGDFVKVMREVGLPYEMLLSDNLMVPFDKHMLMLELSEKELNVQPLGLVLATRQFVAHLTPLFDVLLRQKTVHDSIVALCDNLQIIAEGLKPTLRVEADVAYLEIHTEHSFLSKSSIFHDHAAGLITQYLRWIIGRNFKLTSVSIPHSEPRDLLRFRSFFGCPTSFGDSHIAICFDQQVLHQTVTGKTDSFEREYNQILKWDRSASLMPQVRNIIRRDIASGSSDMAYVAKEMGTSMRTLQRRLAEKGTSFQKQLDSVRAGLTRRLLFQLDLDLADIAMRLGYADQACFTRAFQRWYAKPPSEWRTLIRAKAQ